MEAAIVFAVVFIPFLLFVLLMFKVGKEMPESALHHLEDCTYRVESIPWSSGRAIIAVIFFLILLIPVFVFLVFPALVLITDADPVYLRSGVKEILVLLYFWILGPSLISLIWVGVHNQRRMKGVVLDIRPKQEVVFWEEDGLVRELVREDFHHIRTSYRSGKFPEVVDEITLRNGDKLYLSLNHPGYHPLRTMLRHVPATAVESTLPLVVDGVPSNLSRLLQYIRWMKKNSLYELLGILFCAVSFYALQYYEYNQIVLDQLLDKRELKVVGNYVLERRRSSSYHLWLHDGRYPYDLIAPKSVYENALRKGTATAYYNHHTNRYIFRSVDTGLTTLLKGGTVVTIFVLLMRILWNKIFPKRLQKKRADKLLVERLSI